MKIETISDKRFMNYEYYIKQPLQMIGLKLNVIFSESPHLVNSLDRSFNYTLLRNYSSIPFLY